jgi:glycerol-3-phosphate acyltransferase PlsY
VDYPALSSTQLIVIIIGYGLGCISTGYYLVRLRTGQDIRKLGSGSMGGRNVGRVLGRSGFALTMAGDTVKGIIAVRLPLHDLVLHFQYLHNPH